jgi:hypothetical protein
MKKIIVLGLCLVTTVSVFSVRDTKSNEVALGSAKIVALNEQNGNNKITSAIPTTLTHVNWAKILDQMIWISAVDGKTDSRCPYYVGDTVEKSLSNVELQDEIDSKLKTL